jgi:AGCS family alanine or glycine:cation symporter|tara:strand:+ start:9262 stop:11082 length:1821 start_codon:yes stop_codon:yes gene_type:complete
MKNNSYYFLVSFFLLFVSIQSCLLSQINQSSSIIGEYSYSEIIGLDVSIGPNDYLSLSKDGTFEYEVGLINAFGQWSLIEDTLKFHYNSPIDTVRLFKIVELSSTKLHLSEGLLQFKFTHSFSNKVNMFSKGVNDLFSPVVDKIGGVIFYDITKPFNADKNIPFIVMWLVFGALYFTFRMNFINIRGFKHAIELVRGDYSDPSNKGEVSHFQALTTALSGTVGLGNIAGVAIAISLGGPGATFWMIVAGLLGMSSKFVECTLGLKYRIIDEDGVVSGGPMYYLRDGLAKKKLKNIGKVLSILFAVLCIGGSIGGGNMFQANQAFAALKGVFPSLTNFGPLFGICLATLVGFVIIGGIKSIAKVTEKVVPFMAAIYVGAALIIIMLHISDVGFVVKEIIKGAFTPEAGLGGFIGVLIIGFKRAAFSNEAGVGSASIAHSAAKTKEPVSEGMVALLEPFIDTIVICTMTAFVIIITGSYQQTGDLGGSELTSQAFGSVISWFPYILTIAILLFAFSTMISWSYYGLKSWTFLFGKSKYSELSYKMMFMIFIVIGSSASLGSVVDFSDMMILAMAFPNIIGLLILSSEVKEDLRCYLRKLKDGTLKKYK